jgi:hypothetical protein
MLQVGVKVGQKQSCVDLMEYYASLTGCALKRLKTKGGNTVVYKCISFDEQSEKCDCPFSVQFGRKHKNLKGDDDDVWFISKKNFCVEHDKICSNNSTAVLNEQLQQQTTTAITSKNNIDTDNSTPTTRERLYDSHFTVYNSRLFDSLLAMRLLLNVYMDDIDE